jgi:predicted nucleic acid-binding protein
MGTEYLLDSNVIIGYLDNKISGKGMAFVSGIVDKIPNVSIISKMEVLRFQAPPQIGAVLSAFFDNSNILPLNDDVVTITIDICKQHKIKLPDAIIAATAVCYHFILMTGNTKDFKNITGLTYLNPWNI